MIVALLIKAGAVCLALVGVMFLACLVCIVINMIAAITTGQA